MQITRLLLQIIFVLTISFASATSIDCDATLNAATTMVCDSEELRALDLELGNATEAYSSNTLDHFAFVNAQRVWLLNREACSNVDCLRIAYKSRIRELDSPVFAELSEIRGADQKEMRLSLAKQVPSGIDFSEFITVRDSTGAHVNAAFFRFGNQLITTELPFEATTVVIKPGLPLNDGGKETKLSHEFSIPERSIDPTKSSFSDTTNPTCPPPRRLESVDVYALSDEEALRIRDEAYLDWNNHERCITQLGPDPSFEQIAFSIYESQCNPAFFHVFNNWPTRLAGSERQFWYLSSACSERDLEKLERLKRAIVVEIGRLNDGEIPQRVYDEIAAGERYVTQSCRAIDMESSDDFIGLVGNPYLMATVSHCRYKVMVNLLLILARDLQHEESYAWPFGTLEELLSWTRQPKCLDLIEDFCR